MAYPGAEERAAMFSRIAGRYDRINAVLSWGLIGRWRRALLRHLPADLRPRDILDLCCGTGAMTEILTRAYPAAAVWAVDFAPGMLERARGRLAGARGSSPRFLLADQNRLPFAKDSFDLVVNAFGLRNSVFPVRSLAEMLRVLRPGGCLGLLELTRPEGGFFGRLFSFYFFHLTPFLAGILGGEKAAYRYLPASLAEFFTRAELAAVIRGLAEGTLSVIPLFGSVVTLFLFIKPSRKGVDG
ncbi:MAG: ubiquinone/menaquinone biosynthesis methyltransferase [Firmicutes bacterium]|nr:ubiquinone/menaquinone biosynthesis methyltransferase [Bacillota bacterium]